LKLLNIVARGILILLIPLFCLSFTIDREFSTVWFYTRGFSIHNVSMQTGLSEEELPLMADRFVAYFNSPEERINITFGSLGISWFTPEEIDFFQQVKELVNANRYIMFGSLGLILIDVILLGLDRRPRRNWRNLGQSLLGGSILTAVLGIFVMIGVATSSELLFRNLISFFNNYWWYADGFLRQFFPWEFWYDMLMFTILITSVAAAFIGGAGYALMQLTTPKETALPGES
jgi:hypothetical protein